ncbi:hypothetical protein LYNGBM3L_34380 [Moorena producens 3L]|uniref:Uncharacterized protein n=1 Tax=Moorena producens 3L TaxID=489825 RepID=F4XPL6_9CYAN|nr:hypothetical protein LYNGBM3L_34380 [Moorena producens 3L]
MEGQRLSFNQTTFNQTTFNPK